MVLGQTWAGDFLFGSEHWTLQAEPEVKGEQMPLLSPRLKVWPVAAGGCRPYFAPDLPPGTSAQLSLLHPSPCCTPPPAAHLPVSCLPAWSYWKGYLMHNLFTLGRLLARYRWHCVGQKYTCGSGCRAVLKSLCPPFISFHLKASLSNKRKLSAFLV